MSPNIATTLFTLGVLGLFVLDRDRQARTSKGLWVPVIWLLINGSRPVSLWLDSHATVKLQNASQYLDGNPVERFVYASLVLAGLLILMARRPQVGRLLQ